MMTRTWPRHYGWAAIGFGTAAASIYLLMIAVTLAHLKTVSGHIPFDMRPFGYGTIEAAELLDALGSEGRWYYLNRQIPLDTVYPAFLALTLVFAMLWFGARLPKSKLVRIGIKFSVGAAVFDYGENLGIVAMILSWPNLSDALVHATSVVSVAKSALTSVAVLTLVLIVLLWVRYRKVF